MRFRVTGLACLVLIGLPPALPAEGPEVWPSLHAAATHLADLLMNDLGTWPGLVEAVCVVQAEEGAAAAETPAAVAAVGVALERHGFRTLAAPPAGAASPGACPVIQVSAHSLPGGQIMRVRLAGKQYQAVHADKDWVDGPLPAGWLKADSEPRSEEQEARGEADRRLLDQVWTRSANRLSPAVPAEAFRCRLAVLLTGSDIRRDEFTEKIAKPYGVLFRHHVAAAVPEDAIDRELARMVRDQRVSRQQCWGAVALILASWLGGFWAIIRLDRWTQGYRRPVIITVVLLLLLAGTGFLWAILPMRVMAWGS